MLAIAMAANQLSFILQYLLTPSTLLIHYHTGPTSRRAFDREFQSRDIGYVGFAGESYEAATGLYTVQGSGADIWHQSDKFHYMYLETSGDITFTVLVEGFSAAHEWAKGGVSGE